MHLRVALIALFFSYTSAASLAADWQPKQAALMTRWAKEVTPEKVHPEYPRPQMVRKQWQNLNGLWDYAIRPTSEEQPKDFDGQILVPFPVESALSGVMKPVGPNNRLWYRRSVKVEGAGDGKRILLHFGAVDWDSTVYVNGKKVGEHRGGYDPFTFDITDALKPNAEQEIVISVLDPSDASFQPRGKQVLRPHSIWYTPTTGIWQTVWLEAVPTTYIKSLQITPDVDQKRVVVKVEVGGDAKKVGLKVMSDAAKAYSAGPTNEVVLDVSQPRLWSPDDPYLYDLKVTIDDDKARDLDEVQTYFGMRKISLGKDDRGITRLMLNNKFLFQYGPLDQGFWPDGLYTAPTDEALKYDLEVTKRLGFNMVRKHVKVEPARWYYHCDKLGLLVWQDMPSGDKYIRADQPDITRTPESTSNFENEWRNIIRANINSPAIIMWVPFNEGWGQFDTARIVEFTRKQDPSRLVNATSGWTDRKVGDVHDIHVYPGPGSPRPEEKRAAVLGEFGGLGLPLEGHTWQARGNWGYRNYTDRETLGRDYVNLLERMHPLIGDPGLSAAVYTQTTDVEIEVNGLMTYDRAVIKFDEKLIADAARTLHLPPPKVREVVPTAQARPIPWHYVTSKPADGWERADFDDSTWQHGRAGFGTENTPGTTVRTEWNTPDIWIRRTFELEDAKLNKPQLVIHHDENAEIYINGVLAAKVQGYTTSYTRVSISKEAAAALRAGENVFAVHCHQTGGGQYIDIGLADIQAVGAK
jgi:hypothetical protein